uniref:Uncharacterized protein n=1 Tax=Opuntia streptacantha TaxID=393608 RepID=A0A7C8ZGH5_OPUST
MSSRAARARSATVPSMSGSASTTRAAAPHSTATRRFPSDRQRARRIFVADFAAALSFMYPTTPLITTAGTTTAPPPSPPPEAASEGGFGTRERSIMWRAERRSDSEPAVNLSSATWNNSRRSEGGKGIGGGGGGVGGGGGNDGGGGGDGSSGG